MAMLIFQLHVQQLEDSEQFKGRSEIEASFRYTVGLYLGAKIEKDKNGTCLSRKKRKWA